MSEADGKITWRVRGIESIANEMMKGLSPDRYIAASEEEKKLFLEKYGHLIKKIVPHLPRGYSSVGAAVCKCAIRYGEKRAIEFLTNLKYTVFKGKKDPVYLFSLWIDNPRREKKNRIPYKLAMVACRAYCQERELVELRVPAGDRDIFEWEDNWEFDADRYGKRKGRRKRDRKSRFQESSAKSRTKYTKAALEPVVKESVCMREVLEKLGLSPCGGNHTRIMRGIRQHNLSIDHFIRETKETRKKMQKNMRKEMRKEIRKEIREEMREEIREEMQEETCFQ